ncbi:hypothetical protein SUGI_0239460 [Cryptomeria japonica]|nr:hypothetical protein SUGI_0239460 [Cryptomeria japonica]
MEEGYEQLALGRRLLLLVSRLQIRRFQAVWGRGYKEYRLGDYSNWLQKRVTKTSNWNKIKSRLPDTKVCNKLAYDSVGQVAEEFYQNKLSPIQSGCCKPPSSCSFVYVNATYWTSTAGNFTDMECNKWSNDEDEVCYNCDSCKAGVLANVKHHLRVLAVINIMMLILMLLDFSVACCVLDQH